MQVEKIDWVVDQLQEARLRGDVMQRSRQSDASWPMIQMAARADPRVVAGLEFYRAAHAGDPGVTTSWHSGVTTPQESGKVADVRRTSRRFFVDLSQGFGGVCPIRNDSSALLLRTPWILPARSARIQGSCTSMRKASSKA